MCMRVKNWDKGEVRRAFPQFCENTRKLYILRHCITIVFIMQENHIIPLTFIF